MLVLLVYAGFGHQISYCCNAEPIPCDFLVMSALHFCVFYHRQEDINFQ